MAIGGGSGYTNTTGAIKGGIGIDLGFFREISIDAAKNRMTVGGGVIFEDIFDPLYSVGKEIRKYQRLPRETTVISYTRMGTPGRADILSHQRPDPVRASVSSVQPSAAVLALTKDFMV